MMQFNLPLRRISSSYEDALKIASVIERDYCPTLAGARWGVPQSVVNNSKNEQVNTLKNLAKYFIDEWKNQCAIANGTKKSFFQKLFHS